MLYFKEETKIRFTFTYRIESSLLFSHSIKIMYLNKETKSVIKVI
jgi:hypothetical protein